MPGRRTVLVGAGMVGVGAVGFGGYRYWRWTRGRTPRIFARNIFTVGYDDLDGNHTADGATITIPDHETADHVLNVDEEITGILRETTFDTQFLIGVLTGAQTGAEFTVDGIEQSDTQLAISLSYSFPMYGPHGDDFTPQSVLIRVDGTTVPGEIATTVTGPH